MGKVPPGCARTTPPTRRLIQQSTASFQTLAARFGSGPKPASTVLTPAEEAAIGLFRQQTLLSLDDCPYALPDALPALSRSALHRCFHRHSSRCSPPGDPEGEAKKAAFKA